MKMDGTIKDGLGVAPKLHGARGPLSRAQSLIEHPLLTSGADNSGRHNLNPPDIGFWALVAEDYRTQEKHLFSQGFWALFWHRFGNWRMSVRPRTLRMPLTLLYRVGARLCEWNAGIMLPYTVLVGRRVRLEHFGGMILIARAIGDDVTIRQNTTFGIPDRNRPGEWPTIGDGVDIGCGAVVIGDITIGRGAKIGANAVVNRDVPAGAVAVGVPARVIRTG